MSTEILNRIIKEVNTLTPQERLELIDRLTHAEQNSPLREWLNEARSMRAELPLTSDSADILRELREVRSINSLNRIKARRTPALGPIIPQ